MLKQYVAGFLFDPMGQYVVLIKKNKPDWQKGRLNGPGGSIEDTDASPRAAMSREFSEETGVVIPETEWLEVCKLVDLGRPNEGPAEVFFFTARSPLAFSVQSPTPEQVRVYRLTDLNMEGDKDIVNETLPNLKWLIPMALAEDPRGPYTIYE